MNVFTVKFSVYVTPCTPIPLVEIYEHVLPCTPVISVGTSVHALTQSSMHVTRSSVHVLPRAYLLILTCVCVSVHGLLQESVHIHPWQSVLAVAVTRVCMLFCTINSCEVTLAMDIVHLMSTYGVLLGIPCIIARNHQSVASCSGLVKKYEYIYLVGHYFREKSPFSIQYFIKNYCTRMFFVRFVLDYLPLFSMII